MELKGGWPIGLASFDDVGSRGRVFKVDLGLEDSNPFIVNHLKRPRFRDADESCTVVENPWPDVLGQFLDVVSPSATHCTNYSVFNDEDNLKEVLNDLNAIPMGIQCIGWIQLCIAALSRAARCPNHEVRLLLDLLQTTCLWMVPSF